MKFKVGLQSAIFTLTFVCISFLAKSQDDIEGLLLAGVEDANTLAEGYIEPFMNSFSTGLTGGWYSSGKTHKPLGMELLITANSVFIPSDDFFYSPNFINADYADPDVTRSPTVFGPENGEPQYRYDVDVNGQNFSGTFDAPPGIGLKENFPMEAIPVPMAQLGIGIYKNTDLKIRWTPKIDIGDDGEFKLLGFGIMHDVKQHIPGLKNIPFDLSALIGFTDMSLEYDLASATANNSPDASISTTNGKSTFDVNAWTIQGIISKKFSVISFYGGLGYNIVNSSLKLSGDYDITYDDGVNQEIETIVNPVNLEFSQSGPRLTAGFRLKLAIVTINADYTLQKNSMLTVGFGFSFREASSTN
ncbi:DUF6588 family protein [Fulvivirga lutea]|uniref:Uncharacterized protein n=1 Tax=Fulvivirga lutea TaxID=2810512 RepID=A0A974WIB4_9BACT|nr:DUF6588 family protein [Fulvivirga lutea]QSE97682.1 hypothetical protein JR347_00930 [Fulvivirga lutea]